MKPKIINTILPLLLLLNLISISSIQAQVLTPFVISSGGDYFKQINGSLDWTIGECVTETFETNDNSLTQGFHQGSYNYAVVEEKGQIGNDINIYPNPAEDFFTIDFNGTGSENYSFILYDLNGKILIKEKIISNKTQVPVKSLPVAIYQLKVFNQKMTKFKTFKIAKLK